MKATGQPFMLGRALRLVVAERLVRRICTECRVDITGELPSNTFIDIGLKPEEIGSFRLFGGKGCGSCHGTGYRGRVGLFEVMEISDGIRDFIKAGATAAEIEKKALEEGLFTLRMSGLEKIKNGLTTIEEVRRETAC